MQCNVCNKIINNDPDPDFFLTCEECEKEHEMEDLETLMKDTYSSFAHWENDSQLEAFEEYLDLYKKYILLDNDKERNNER